MWTTLELDDLVAGAEEAVEVDLDLTPTRERDPATRTWSPRPGIWSVVVASSSPTSTDGARPLAAGSTSR